MLKLYKNIVFNFIGQFYLNLLSVLMAPIYVRYLGLEAYGLVGFFILIQSSIQLIDLGFTATITRLSAQYCSGSISSFEFRSIFKAIQGLFVVLGFSLIFISYPASQYFSMHWIHVEKICMGDLNISLILIFLISIIRWQGGLYKGVISGFEYQVWLNQFNMILATIKYVGVLFFIIYFSQNIKDFFLYQLLVGLIELLILIRYVYIILPQVKEKIVWKLDYIKKNIFLALSIALTSSVWVLVTQLDKLILSKYLKLSDYACYTLAITVASIIHLIFGPIFAAVSPRFSGLIVKNDLQNFIELYKKTTRFLVVLMVPVLALLVFNGDKVLFAWTKNTMIVEKAYPILIGYAIGNVFMAILGMPYNLQLAYGKLRLHLLGNLFFVTLMLPALIFATLHWQAVGASYVWMLSNLIYLLFWVPVIHRKFLSYSHFEWLRKDVFQLSIFSIILTWVLMKCFLVSSQRWYIVLESSSVILMSILFTSAVFFPELRNILLSNNLYLRWIGSKSE